MSLTSEEKWALVKDFYESSYFDPENPKKKIRFLTVPDQLKIEFLYQKMVEFQKGRLAFYDHKPGLRELRLKSMGLETEKSNDKDGTASTQRIDPPSSGK